MAKKATITPVTDTVNNAAAINTQLNAINDQLENTLSLDGSVPNAMGADLDLNNNDLLNVGTINGASASGLSAGLTTVIGLSTDIATVAGISADVTQVAADTVAINAASANASAAAASAGAASTSETNAAASEAAAAASYDAFDDRYLGAKAVEPTLDNDGAALLTGALYFNTVADEMRVYNGAAWVAAYVSLGGALLSANNLSDLANATTSRTNLGVAIGTDVQAYDANLNSFVGAFTLPTVDGTAGQLLNTDGAGTIAFTDPVSPFAPVAVSGATQALDVGTYNFFDAGTLTADTTISFSSVPTQARWTYTFEVGATEVYTLDGASGTGKFYGVGSQDAFPAGLFFKSDGTKMYVSGQGNDGVYQYTLSTAWDVTTASYDSVFLDVSSRDTNVRGIFFKPDGTKLFISGASTTGVYEYTLSTAWDISTASYDSFFSVSGQETSPYDIFFKPDGTKFYLAGASGQDISQYSLSTAWDISTASFDSKTYSLTPVDGNNASVCLTPDGTRLFAFGDDITQHTLSTAWDISTASYDSLSLTGVGSQGRSLRFKDGDGSILFALSDSSNSVIEIASATPSSVTLPSSIENDPSEAVRVGDRVTYTFFTLDGGTTVTLISEEVL